MVYHCNENFFFIKIFFNVILSFVYTKMNLVQNAGINHQ